MREPVRVEMHLDAGFTRVMLLRTEGLGMANGGTTWDIPTQAIPSHLRPIGSRFWVVMPNIEPVPIDSVADLRASRAQVQIEEFRHDENTDGIGRASQPIPG